MKLVVFVFFVGDSPGPLVPGLLPLTSPLFRSGPLFLAAFHFAVEVSDSFDELLPSMFSLLQRVDFLQFLRRGRLQVFGRQLGRGHVDAFFDVVLVLLLDDGQLLLQFPFASRDADLPFPLSHVVVHEFVNFRLLLYLLLQLLHQFLLGSIRLLQLPVNRSGRGY